MSEKKRETYYFSVIMPVYNAEKTVADSIDSVINQTIGFNNIQLIIVNDGSIDESKSICEKYAEEYLSNVRYIEKENGGVSSARNKGLEYVEGKYTIFLDSDDTWDKNSFKTIYNFFEKKGADVDVCSCKIEFTGDFTGKTHPLDYKFDDGSRVVSLQEEPRIICSTIGNNVFRSSAIKDLVFNTKISAGEDAHFNYSVLINNPKVGIIPDAVFYYRRDNNGGSGSSSAPQKKSWYLDVPKEYYLSLEEMSIDKYGEVTNYVQAVILYDLRWRHYNRHMVEDVLNDQEKQEHIKLMHSILEQIDLENIQTETSLNQYRRLYLSNLKYGKEIINDAERKDFRFYYEGQSVLSLRGKTMLVITAFDINNDNLHIEGTLRANTTKKKYELYVLNKKGERFHPEIQMDPDRDIKGYIGEIISAGERFSTDIPIKTGEKLRFLLDFDGDIIELRPNFAAYIGLNSADRNNYCINNGYIVKLRKNELSFYEDRIQTRVVSEIRLSQEMLKKRKKGWSKDRRKALQMIAAANDGKIKERIAFISVRSDELSGNLEEVYTSLNKPKAYYCKKKMYENYADIRKASRLLYSSKVVVTDDYLFLFRNNKKRQGQYYVQLWHAAGAFKKFGSDISVMPPGMDKMYHRDYDIVAVSSDYVRDIYAKSFQIDTDRVQALGVPRTDMLFDKDYLRETRDGVFDKLPELEGKQVILYAPTFRGEGNDRIYLPEIDYERFNETLKDNQVVLLCPHPMMPKYEDAWKYDKIKLIQDIPTAEVMIIADLLITDYSSIVFDYSLLDKPVVFFCYDYDDYERDYYLDYEKELPGEIFKSSEELISYLEKGSFTTDDRMRLFREKYMSACDGHSTERVVKAIEKLLSK